MVSRAPSLQCCSTESEVGPRAAGTPWSRTTQTDAEKKNYRWKRIRKAPALKPASDFVRAKRSDWELLKQWAEAGEVCLKYLDESGCCCESSTEYAYNQRGKQKRVHQRQPRGRRVNIWGVWQPQVGFDYALMIGSLKTPTFLQLMDWQGAKAEAHFKLTRQLTVIVLDNASVHRSRLTQERLKLWQQQGLLLFFLPPYNPQMNRIEDQWLHLKRDELAGRVFEDEFDLAMAIIEGMESKAQQGHYVIERFIFT